MSLRNTGSVVAKNPELAKLLEPLVIRRGALRWDIVGFWSRYEGGTTVTTISTQNPPLPGDRVIDMRLGKQMFVTDVTGIDEVSFSLDCRPPIPYDGSKLVTIGPLTGEPNSARPASWTIRAPSIGGVEKGMYRFRIRRGENAYWSNTSTNTKGETFHTFKGLTVGDWVVGVTHIQPDGIHRVEIEKASVIT